MSIADWMNKAGPNADESLAEFVTLYQSKRGAGVNRDELAQLAVHYHRALRRLDSFRAATDSTAGTAAQIVGATVATLVVTIASAGSLGPIAVGALATMSSAASSCAAGAAIRVGNSISSLLHHAGMGVIEGLTATAGASLTAHFVRSATVGLPAGRATATVAANAISPTSRMGAEISCRSHRYRAR